MCDLFFQGAVVQTPNMPSAACLLRPGYPERALVPGELLAPACLCSASGICSMLRTSQRTVAPPVHRCMAPSAGRSTAVLLLSQLPGAVGDGAMAHLLVEANQLDVVLRAVLEA